MFKRKIISDAFKIYTNALGGSILQLIYLQYISQFQCVTSYYNMKTIRIPPISTVQNELTSPNSNIFKIISKVSSLLCNDQRILDSLNCGSTSINNNDMHRVHQMFMNVFTNRFAYTICDKIHNRFHDGKDTFKEWPDISFDWDKLLSQEDNVVDFIIMQTQLNIDVNLNYTDSDYPGVEPNEEYVVLLEENVIAEVRSNTSIVPLYVDVAMICKYENNWDNYINDRLIRFATDTYFTSAECTYLRPPRMSYWIHTNPFNTIEYHKKPTDSK